MRSAEMIVEWSFNVVCPYCEADIDVAEQDDEGLFSILIFNNNWNALEGVEAYCPDCSENFTISKVEC